MWDERTAAAYDAGTEDVSTPEHVEPVVDVLADLAAGGRVLELAIGTGRIALPLRARGVEVHGIELSPHMAAVLAAKPGGELVPVAIGDMATTRVDGAFRLVYLVFNTIMNVTTQDEQVAVFQNAAAHLEPGGRFVVEVLVPQLRRLPPGELGRVFAMSPDHVGIETFDADDVVGQISWSHHWSNVDGRLVHHAAPYRYVWPSELDLMGRLAGFCVLERWGGWDRRPFAGSAVDQVVVFEKVR